MAWMGTSGGEDLPCQRGVYARADAYQSTRHSELEVVMFLRGSAQDSQEVIAVEDAPANRETTRLRMGLHWIFPASSFDTIPGRISISSPSLSTPVRILPPATPPFSSSMSAPGLLTCHL